MTPLTAEDLQTTLLNAIETIADARMEITHDRALADLMRDPPCTGRFTTVLSRSGLGPL